jgi:glycosyltransferase involved in cell wall biosynthesis
MSESEPLVSIIIPCYKMGQYIGEALASLGAQSYSAWEVIAIDDCGPEDGTQAAVEDFRQLYPTHRVEYLRLPQNRGVSSARNAGIAAARGELVAFLDADDWWLPHHLETHFRARQDTEAAVDVTGSAMRVKAEDGIEGWPDEWGFTPWEASCFPATLSLRCALNPSSSVVSKEVLSACGGFDTAPEMQHVEDYDLWFRLQAAGARFRILPEVTAVYRKHAGAATAPSQRLVAQKRAEALATKHYKQWLPSLAFTTYLLSERVGHLENRVKWLEKSLVARVEARLRGVLKSLLKYSGLSK